MENIYFLVGKLMMPPENREDPAGRSSKKLSVRFGWGLFFFFRHDTGRDEQRRGRNDDRGGDARPGPGDGHVVRASILLVNHLKKLKPVSFQLDRFGSLVGLVAPIMDVGISFDGGDAGHVLLGGILAQP